MVVLLFSSPFRGLFTRLSFLLGEKATTRGAVHELEKFNTRGRERSGKSSERVVVSPESCMTKLNLKRGKGEKREKRGSNEM
jgi:hypothetical protein